MNMNSIELPEWGARGEELRKGIDQVRANLQKYDTADVLKLLFGCIDLTTLSTSDNLKKVEKLSDLVAGFGSKFPKYPNVAAVCVYPNFVSAVNQSLAGKNIGVASVAGGFPSSQTFSEIKSREVELAVQGGATEIDVVMPVGVFLDGDYLAVKEEIAALKRAAGNAKLKVILETGLLEEEGIYKASHLCMSAGADFIKTSTGKLDPPATPEVVWIMATAILDYYRENGKKVGIKPAGGISTPEDALLYYGIIHHILGREWLRKEYFRIGASRLANNLLERIQELENPSLNFSPYF